MSNPFFFNFPSFPRRWFNSVAGVFGGAWCFGRFAPAFAGNSWLDLLIRGAQVIQLYNISDKEKSNLASRLTSSCLAVSFSYRNPDVNRYIDQIGQQLAASSQRPDIHTFPGN